MKFRSAVLEVCSHRLRYLIHITLQRYTQTLALERKFCLVPGLDAQPLWHTLQGISSC